MNKKFHHLGIASKNIEEDLKHYESLGYKISSDYFIDENQGIRAIFIEAEDQPRLELIEALENQNMQDPAGIALLVKKGIKIYHIAYSVENLAEFLDDFISKTKAMVISPIKDATYFKKVCFLVLKNMQIVEVVEER